MFKKFTLILILLVAFQSNSQEKFVIKNLNINTSYSNFGTSFFGEDKVVYASPRKKSIIIRNEWDGNNQPFLDLYIGTIAPNGDLQDVEKFSSNLNTRYHEADVAFTKDKRTVYFSRNNYLDKKFKKDSKGVNLIQLYRAFINEQGEWVNVEEMPFNNDEYQTGHPALSSDEKTLYFISDMPGTFGKTDVFKASIGSNGEIGLPVNLGSEINTSEREMFVSICGDDELYFSSDGRNDGLGGFDIYVSKINEKNISEPHNLGKPINSDKDDFAFIINNNTRKGYFSSNRDGGKGDDDIYYFEELPCMLTAKGIVLVKESKHVLQGALVELFNKKGEKTKEIFTNNLGEFSFNVDCDSTYKVFATKENYSNKEIIFTASKDILLNGKLELEISPMEFIEVRDKLVININPIYFDLDKSEIRDDAAIELEKVVNVMNKFPKLKIEIGSHTDSRAVDSYNMQLSERRAQSSINWIIKKGIDPERITGKGYGETILVNNCANNVKCSEAEHQLNRRTEFVIVNPEDIK